MNHPAGGGGDVGGPHSAGRLAHDLFNVLTVLYGLQEEVAELVAEDKRQAPLATALATVVHRLQDIGTRLQRLHQDDSADSQGRGSR